MNNIVAGVITAHQIYDELQKGSTDLYTKRFDFGRENDYNEFSYSLEEHDLHPLLPFSNSLEDLANLSKNATKVFSNMMVSRAEDKSKDSRFDEEPIIEDVALLKSELTLSYSYKIDDDNKYENRTNVDIIDLLTHQELYDKREWTFLTKFNDSKYIALNKTTVLDNAFTSNRNLTKLNRTRRLGELLGLITSNTLCNIPKESRPQLYYVYNGMRPDNTQYQKWNGLQVFDLDLKYSRCFPTMDKQKTKELLFELLKQYKWFVGIGFSSSGKGLHIYTKVARPHQYYIDEQRNEDLMRYWYQMSYTQKYAVIRYVLENVCKVDNGDDPQHPVIDFAMAKISQGVRISYDADFLINPDFEDIQPIMDYHHAPVEGLEFNQWLLKDYIIDNKIFKMWIQQHEVSLQKHSGTYVEQVAIDYGDTNVSLPEGKQPTPFNGEVFYQLRYNVCNTIAAFFGELGREYAHIILKSDVCRNKNEVNGIYNCAINSKKKPTKYGLQILKSCGFNVALGDDSKQSLAIDTKKDLVSLIEKAAASVDVESKCSLKLKQDEYLGNHTEFLLGSVKPGMGNLLTSPPGTGKTELVKSLSKNYRVLLVLPYISVIDAKVVRDNDLGENFDAYFGATKVSDIKKGKSAVMTLDKFGRVDIDKIAYMYDYVMIDESHLIFTSSFRLEAMANSLKNIKTLIDMSKFDDFSAKLVMMTGTPTGERPYFNFYQNLNEILVRKEESRTKTVEFVLCNDIKDMQAKISMQIADCIKNGKKVLYPTNDGDVQAAKLIGMIEHQLGRTIKWSYYKKANTNSEMATSINENATVGDYELILASNYLSVGIDIKDFNDFECIYDSSFAGYEIEQFNCRLRNVDIISRVYIPLYNAENDIMKNLLNYSDFSIKMNREDRDLMRDYVDISKKKLELSVSYDPITNRIFTPGFRIENGQIVFKLEEHELTMFEERFLETMRSPYFIAYSLAEYGYTIRIVDSNVIDKKLTNELIKVGLENAKIESQIKNDLGIYTFEWLMDNDNYLNSFGMEYPNLVNRIWKEGITIDEDPNNKGINIEESMIGEVAKIIVPDRRIFDEQLAVASRFLSLYSMETSKFIYQQCIKKSGKINKSEVSRYMRLMQLVKMEERGNLGNEIYETIKFMYEYIDPFLKDEQYGVATEEHQLRIDFCTQLYLRELQLDLRSQKMTKKYRDEVSELMNVICTKYVVNGLIHLDFRLLPTPDNSTRKKLKEYDSILKQMFEISDDRLPKNLQEIIRIRHLPTTDINAIETIQNVRDGEMAFLSEISPI